MSFVISQPTSEPMPYKVSEAKLGFTKEMLEKFAAEQMHNEKAGTIKIENIFVKSLPVTEDVQRSRALLEELYKSFRKDILHAFNSKVEEAEQKMQAKKPTTVFIYPYLKVLKPDQVVEILMNEVEELGLGSEEYTPTLSQISQRIGYKVHLQHEQQQRDESAVTDKVMRIYKSYCDNFCAGDSNDNPRQLWQRKVYHERGIGPDIDIRQTFWPLPVIADIGRTLLTILLENIRIDAEGKGRATHRVFYSTFRHRNLMLREEVRPHPKFVELIRSAQTEQLKFGTDLVPMVCPPIPWTSTKHGGYLTIQSDFIRSPFSCGMQYDRIERLSSPSELYPTLDALNQLGSVAWRINTRVLDLVIDLFNKGGNDKFHVPAPPKRIDPMQTPIETNGYNGMNGWQEQQATYSLGCDILYKLSLANHFRDKPFWMPHNLDFRGRVYPVPPHLNHLSSDLIRALLIFNQERPLGVDGLKWLKLHCINLTGLKKRESYDDRLAYAEEVLDDILDSADNPIDGRHWWLNSDDPWQTLACCMEIASATRSPDPVTYMSRFPVHQDGSCNGLQHYAALGRDKVGAISVNLGPCHTPQDVYSSVLQLVEKGRAMDAELGNVVAKQLENCISRKVIKQTVMTTVYGVTMFGARLQIEKQLKDATTLSITSRKKAGHYVAQKTFGSLNEMFTSATKIQEWFNNCARFIAKERKRHVEWKTPLGLPVVQPYTKGLQGKQKLNVRNIQSSAVSDRHDTLNALKEINAFPPNFIHSLDSCHMMLTSVHCERAGITFVSVHDCFWTHACSVPIMNRICREQFISLHKQPILRNLSDFFNTEYKP